MFKLIIFVTYKEIIGLALLQPLNVHERQRHTDQPSNLLIWWSQGRNCLAALSILGENGHRHIHTMQKVAYSKAISITSFVTRLCGWFLL